MIQLYKFKNNFNKLTWYHPITEVATRIGDETGPSSGTRRPKHTLYRQFVRNCAARNNFFSNRTAPLWNELDQETINAKTINSFKNKYDETRIIVWTLPHICHSEVPLYQAPRVMTRRRLTIIIIIIIDQQTSVKIQTNLD